MRSVRVLAVLCLLSASIAAAPAMATEYPEPPQKLFEELFVAVQSARIYPDGKTFADAIPLASPTEVLQQFHSQRPHSRSALRDFVGAHFTVPSPATAAPSSIDLGSLVEHIDGLWESLTRSTPLAAPYSSLLALPRPYVVPGGRFREIYYWDSFFSMLGLSESGRHALVADMVGDFAFMIDTWGHIPNGARTYYLSRSQPPFFFAMVALLQRTDPASSFLQFLPQLRREYSFWMQGSHGLKKGTAHRRVVAMPDGSVLNRFWDDRDTPRDESYREDIELARASHRPAHQLFRDIRAAAESGWDFSSRWFGDGHTRGTMNTTQIVPVDLNSLMYGLENAIRSGCERGGDSACVREFARRAATRRRAIDNYLWDGPRRAYLDYNWLQRARVPRISAATLYPLFVSLASAVQAAAVAATTAGELLKPGGIVSTTVDTRQQWDAPNGWAPLQWIAVSGLRAYGLAELAALVACRWIANVNVVYRRTGKLVEKYDVVTLGRSGGGGEYPSQDGFGWTNGVTRTLIALYPGDAAFTSSAQCPDTH